MIIKKLTTKKNKKLKYLLSLGKLKRHIFQDNECNTANQIKTDSARFYSTRIEVRKTTDGDLLNTVNNKPKAP